MTPKTLLWLTTMMITGVISTNVIAGTLYHLPAGVGCLDLAGAIIFGAAFIITIKMMHQRRILVWWHPIPAIVAGITLFPDQSPVMGPFCIPGQFSHLL